MTSLLKCLTNLRLQAFLISVLTLYRKDYYSSN
uniref:Uncharacterized protein n=1 Tax=Arundo donax TaxID=35708 RepID=A0A0A8YR55_ARUDO